VAGNGTSFCIVASLSCFAIRKNLSGQQILKGIDLQVDDGAFVVLVGPSGCGKSTLLRTIAGLETPDSGSIQIAGRDVTALEPKERDIGMVFQSYALYPHLTVEDNLSFGLKLRGESQAVIDRRVAEVSEMLGLEPLLHRMPRDMSGGQRQRVAMGRAIARRPKIFLFDEPLSNLDAALRNQVRVEIKKLHAALGATMVYVTHDQVEAMTLADKLVVLSAGAVEQEGPPLEIYERPASQFVAGFLGSPAMNFIRCKITDDSSIGSRVSTDGFSVVLAREDFALPDKGGTVVVGLRPQDVLSVPATDPTSAAVELGISVVEALGFESYVHGSVGADSFVARLATDSSAPLPKRGDVLSVSARPSSIHVFDSASGKSLRRVKKAAA
jgi:sn-glycerol 3-phosphate transport system ATP-binding protein/multiple sugar transport system ATP-binding protein